MNLFFHAVDLLYPAIYLPVHSEDVPDLMQVSILCLPEPLHLLVVPVTVALHLQILELLPDINKLLVTLHNRPRFKIMLGQYVISLPQSLNEVGPK